MRGINFRRDYKKKFKEFGNLPSNFQSGLSITNKDLLENLNRQSAFSPVGDNLASPKIVGDIDTFLESIDRGSPEINASDIFTQRSPVTQAGYTGETFTMPTYAGESVTFPFHILSKRSQARRQQQEQQKIEELQFNEEMVQLSDEIRNEIFQNKRLGSFQDKITEIQDALGGSYSRAWKYMKDRGIDRQMTSQWNNLASLYNKTYENYLKVVSDTDALGRSKYDNETKQLAAMFGDFISNIDDFDPEKLEEYAQFHNKFNESVSISDLAKKAAMDMVGVDPNNPEEIEEATEIIWRSYGDPDFTSEQEKLFRDSLKYYWKNE